MASKKKPSNAGSAREKAAKQSASDRAAELRAAGLRGSGLARSDAGTQPKPKPKSSGKKAGRTYEVSDEQTDEDLTDDEIAASEEADTERAQADIRTKLDVGDVEFGDVDLDTTRSLLTDIKGASATKLEDVPEPSTNKERGTRPTEILPAATPRPRRELDQARRVSRDAMRRRRAERVANMRGAVSPKPVDTAEDAVAAGENWVPSDIRAQRAFSDFPVTETEAANRAAYFGIENAPSGDSRPTTGVRLNEETGAVTPFKALPGTDVTLRRLSQLDTKLKQEKQDIADYATAAEALGRAASMIPKVVREPGGPIEKTEFSGGTTTSADTTTTVENQPVRGGRVNDIVADEDPAEGPPAPSARGLVARAAEILSKGRYGTGSDRAATIGGMLGGQFQPEAVISQGRTVKPTGPITSAGPILAPQDAPELLEFAKNMKEKAFGGTPTDLETGEQLAGPPKPGMPTEWDVKEKGLVTDIGVPLREITEPEVYEPLETRAEKNLRTTRVATGRRLLAPGQGAKLPPAPPGYQAGQEATEEDVNAVEPTGDLDLAYGRKLMERQNEILAGDETRRQAALPGLRRQVEIAMGPAEGKVQVTPPIPYSKGAPAMPGGTNLNTMQMHKAMKSMRQEAGVGGPRTTNQDLALIGQNEAVTQIIARDYMQDVPGVGEGDDDTRGSTIGSRGAEESIETGRTPKGGLGSPLRGASSVAGGPKSTSIKVPLLGTDESGNKKEGTFSGQPVVPSTSKDDKEMTLGELKVVHPLLGSLYDRALGAGRAYDPTSEDRPLTPGTIRFTRNIGGRDLEFQTNLSVVKPSGNVSTPRARGLVEDTSGTYIDPSKAPKVYDYGYDVEPSTGPVSGATTPGQIVAGAGSIYKPSDASARVVGSAEAPIAGVAIDSGGNPIVTDQAAAAQNPGVRRAAMRGYRQQGISQARKMSRINDLISRGETSFVKTLVGENSPIMESPQMVEAIAKQGARKAQVAEYEGSLETARRASGASRSPITEGAGGRSTIDSRPTATPSPSQQRVRVEAGLPATPAGTLSDLSASVARGESYNKAIEDALKAGTRLPRLSEFPVESFKPAGTALSPAPAGGSWEKPSWMVAGEALAAEESAMGTRNNAFRNVNRG